MSKRISHGVQVIPPFNHIRFADDMTLLAQNIVDMQCLMNVIQEFEAWIGIPVNTSKTELMIVDGIAANRADPVRVRTITSPWTSPHGDKETIQGHPLGPNQAVQVFVAKAVGNFRYLGGGDQNFQRTSSVSSPQCQLVSQILA